MSKENIRVAVRFRPISEREARETVHSTASFIFPDEKTVQIKSDSLTQSDQVFQFDEVFSPDTPQKDFYDRACKNVVEYVIDVFEFMH